MSTIFDNILIDSKKFEIEELTREDFCKNPKLINHIFLMNMVKEFDFLVKNNIINAISLTQFEYLNSSEEHTYIFDIIFQNHLLLVETDTSIDSDFFAHILFNDQIWALESYYNANPFTFDDIEFSLTKLSEYNCKNNLLFLIKKGIVSYNYEGFYFIYDAIHNDNEMLFNYLLSLSTPKDINKYIISNIFDSGNYKYFDIILENCQLDNTLLADSFELAIHSINEIPEFFIQNSDKLLLKAFINSC